MNDLGRLLQGSPYQGYAYSYPHKLTYRPLRPPVRLRRVWAEEPRDRLFLYLHVPFCEMRCGFCNLFTTLDPLRDLETAYLDALQRQAVRVREALGTASIARMAVGGGTPTYMSLAGLERLFDLAEELFAVDGRTAPISVETSPLTAEPEKLRLLRERGVERVSIGIQSFVDAEVAAAGRAQKRETVDLALAGIRAAGFPVLNVDLIYGLPGQTVESWLVSLRAALRYRPEELYLYPLYVRSLTGLDRRGEEWKDVRRACYHAGRRLLLGAGYTQVSMRMFRLRGEGEELNTAPLYCCQEDGMVGLGCGARSYTRSLHYSSEYAVGARGVREILADFLARPPEAFDVADYGFELDEEEQRRRYVIKSLLRSEGLDREAYRRRFGADVLAHLPQVAELERWELVAGENGWLRPTEFGLGWSDMIGPWLYSERVRALTETCVLK